MPFLHLEGITSDPNAKLVSTIYRTSDGKYYNPTSNAFVDTHDETTEISLALDTTTGANVWSVSVPLTGGVFADDQVFLVYYKDANNNGNMISIGQFMMVFGQPKSQYSLTDIATRIMQCSVNGSDLRSVLTDIQKKVNKTYDWASKQSGFSA